MKKIIKRSVAMLSALMLTVVSIGGNPALAAQNTSYQTGQNSRIIPINSVSATIKVHANIADSGRQKYIEGSISYGYKKTLKAEVGGHYVGSDGKVRYIAESNQGTACNHTKILSLNKYGNGVCNASKKAIHNAYINGSFIGAVTFPN